VQIGEVIDADRVQIYWYGTLVADVPAEHLVLGGGAPVYTRETKRPAYLDETAAFDPASVPDIAPDIAPGDALVQLMGSPNIASKRWVFEQYDTMVRTNTVAGPGPTDAAVVRIKGTKKGVAVKTDCNGRFVYLNPRKGGRIAVAEAARNVVCAGGKPLAVTNCLNFGNPYKPEVYWVFKEAVGGMGDACEAFGTPVTGGNVSFYNENPEGAVFPTPTIGMLGLVEDVEALTTGSGYRREGDRVFLLSPAAWTSTGGIEGSEYLATVHGRTAGDAPHLDLDEERAVQAAMQALIRAGLVQSAHDVSDGGLAVCLAECSIFSGLGAAIQLDRPVGTRLDALLFGEAQSRIVFTAGPDQAGEVRALAARHGALATQVGTVGGTALTLRAGADTVLEVPVTALRRPYEEAIPAMMAG
jgi:phosphoribosylformylglycinamidine synthase